MLHSKRACLWAGMTTLLLTSLAIGVDPPRKAAAAADGTIKIKLQQVSLAAPGWILTPTDGTTAHLRTGQVLHQMLGITVGKPTELSIGGLPATLVYDGRSCGIKNEFSQIVLQPTRTADGFMSISLKIAKDKAYPVAFPSAMISPGKACSLTVRPGFAMRGQANGLNVLLYDDNMDGKFTVDKDAVRIGDSASGVGVFAPAAKYIASPTGLYEVRELAEDGTSITLAKADEKAGKLQIAFGSEAVELHAAFSSNESSFVASANPRTSPTFAVTPGKYDFRYGVAYAPALNKLVAVVRPARGDTLEVTADKPAKLTMGAPFRFEFQATLSNGKITINPNSVKVKGKNGEEYDDFKWVAAPEVGMMSQGQTATLGRMSFS